MKDIFIFICEDNKEAQEIVSKYFKDGKQLTYWARVPADKREAIISFVDTLDLSHFQKFP